MLQVPMLGCCCLGILPALRLICHQLNCSSVRRSGIVYRSPEQRSDLKLVSKLRSEGRRSSQSRESAKVGENFVSCHFFVRVSGCSSKIRRQSVGQIRGNRKYLRPQNCEPVKPPEQPVQSPQLEAEKSSGQKGILKTGSPDLSPTKRCSFNEPEGGERGDGVSSRKPERSVASRPKRTARKPKKFDDFV